MQTFEMKKGEWKKLPDLIELINEECSVCSKPVHYPKAWGEAECPDCQAPLVGMLMLADEDSRLAYHLGLPIGNQEEEDEDWDEDEYLAAMTGGYGGLGAARDMNDFHCT